jgi:cell division protein FtsB
MALVLVGKWKQRLKPLVLPSLVALLLLYTGDQLLTGERGIVTWRVMKGQLIDLQGNVKDLNDDIARLNRHIERLRGLGRGNKPDPDFVDELVRRELGYIKAGDKVILRSDAGWADVPAVQ